jgi:hypothetical protein
MLVMDGNFKQTLNFVNENQSFIDQVNSSDNERDLINSNLEL